MESCPTSMDTLLSKIKKLCRAFRTLIQRKVGNSCFQAEKKNTCVCWKFNLRNDLKSQNARNSLTLQTKRLDMLNHSEGKKDQSLDVKSRIHHPPSYRCDVHWKSMITLSILHLYTCSNRHPTKCNHHKDPSCPMNFLLSFLVPNFNSCCSNHPDL